jgi:hypothetical protein
MGRRELRIQLNRGPIMRRRALDLSLHGHDVRQGVMCSRQARVPGRRIGDCLIQMITGLPEILPPGEYGSEVDVGGRQIRLSFKRLSKRQFRAGRIAALT